MALQKEGRGLKKASLQPVLVNAVWLAVEGFRQVRSSSMSLKSKYASEPELLSFYRKKLLDPGWAGELSPDELAHIKSQLKQSASLKRRWGFRPSARRFLEANIRAVARNGLSPNDKSVLASVINKRIVSE